MLKESLVLYGGILSANAIQEHSKKQCIILDERCPERLKGRGADLPSEDPLH
jgi:hypothetical protein